MEKITVFMSTFNGERFLREQIESIMNQNMVCVDLFIRDDGSTDNTLEILQELSKRYSNLHFLSGNNIGYGKSFLTLFNIREYNTDYYAFSDQDDVWLPTKLINGINELRKSPSIPSLFFSNMKIVDEQLNIIGIKDFNKVKVSLGSAYTRQRIAGCTMIFNKKLFEYAKRVSFSNYEHHISHEWIYLLCLALNGNVYSSKEYDMLYRRHSGAETSVGQGFKKRIKSEMKQMNKTKNDKYFLSKIIINHYSDELSEKNYKDIYCVAHYKERYSFRLRLIFGRFLNSGNLLLNFRIKFFVFLGKL